MSSCGEGVRELPGVLSGYSSHSRRLPPQTYLPPHAQLPITISLDIRFQHMDLGAHRYSDPRHYRRECPYSWEIQTQVLRSEVQNVYTLFSGIKQESVCVFCVCVCVVCVCFVCLCVVCLYVCVVCM